MTTTKNRRPERILLAAWTAALAALAVATIRSTPAALSGLLLPYLVLVAWRLLAAAPREVEEVGSIAAEPAPPLVEPVAESVAVPLEPPAPADGPEPPRPAPARPRRRSRPRTMAEPPPAAWIEVGPGRFVRGEAPQPEPAPEAPERTQPDPADGPEPEGPAVGEDRETPADREPVAVANDPMTI